MATSLIIMPINPESGGLFVWVLNERGPCPEKWPVDMPAAGKKDKVVLAQYELSVAEFAMSILILEQRYPLLENGENQDEVTI